MTNSKAKPLRVATLNFSGINVSPFEYHDGSNQKGLINQCFKKLLDEFQKLNPDSKWNIAKIDKVLQRERYSILYRPSAGVVRGRLLDKNQFEVVWDAVFEQSQHLVNHLTPSQESINLLRDFDWMMYQAFVTTLYGKINWNNMKGYNVQRYVEDLKRWHEKNYLKWQPKISYVKNYIIRQNLDILFLQEAGHQKLEASIPDDYISFRSGEAMIIVKKYFIVQDPDVSKFHLKFGSKLNFNHDSHYVKLKNYLLCCAHLSSKNLNKKQAEEMEQLFKQIRDEYEELNIIAGVDANHFLQDFGYLNVYPSVESQVTTRKKRSSMQLQFEKSQKLIEEAKDHLITNLIFEQIKVETINCEETCNDLLPNQNHPYDHFIVFGTLKIRNKKEVAQDDTLDIPQLANRYRRGSFANTEVDNDYYDNKIITMSHCQSSGQPQTSPRVINSDSGIKKKTESSIDRPVKELYVDRLRLSQASTYLDKKAPIPSTFSRSNQKDKHQEDNKHIKPQLFYKIQQTLHHEVEVKQNYNTPLNVPKIDQRFLQFSKSPRPVGGGYNFKNSSRQKEGVIEEITTTPKRDKSRELVTAAYRKF